VIATNNVHYATPAHRPLATALAAIRAGCSLDEMDGRLPASPLAHLRSAGEQSRRFARWPGAVERTLEIAQQCSFDLRLAAPNLPDLEVPTGLTDMEWLRELTRRGAALRYPSTHPQYEQARTQIAYELDVIEQLGFPGYFLVLVDIVEFCLARTSTARVGAARPTARCVTRSVSPRPTPSRSVCLFERFLSPERDGPPTSTSTSSTSAARR
jgi:error-prone DNA polymerase